VASRSQQQPLSAESKRELMAMARAAWETMREDDDIKRVMAAQYQDTIISYLQSSTAYQGLLEVDSAPTSFQLPDVETLFDLPLHEQPRLVCEAMNDVVTRQKQQEQAKGAAAANWQLVTDTAVAAASTC
jgi:hypothetical protein